MAKDEEVQIEKGVETLLKKTGRYDETGYWLVLCIAATELAEIHSCSVADICQSMRAAELKKQA